ncbi:chemotaxis protein CheA [Desulfuromonas acetoxidans]|uniref:Chemotaxis protein CheA n=1 Tax=Desulfuromonas acetoxidans (strain DSM 684 / 11070) TaxID=281689 RepID=Q1JWP4_DESA6|nr:chemotaxis protein CheA [Desulfuromonas acetoxidans]EAT14635.1 CheA signal transduction histidine kinases [Desulfuromonas acetoxidans DSM 684]
MQDAPQNAFKEEAYELLSELEDSLLELEEQPEDHETVSKVFRAMHTIKGSGAMFGFTTISQFTHEVETVFDLVRSGELPVSKQLVDLSLKARDHILSLLDSEPDEQGEYAATGAELVAQFQVLSRGGAPASPATQTTTSAESNTAPQSELTTYRIRFRPSLDIMHNGTSIAQLLDELCELGTCRTIAHKANIVDLEELDPENCYSSWDIILTSDCGEDAIRDVFIFVEDDCELIIKAIDLGNDEDDMEKKRLGDILVERGDISQEQIDEVLAKNKRIGDLLVEARLVSRDQVDSALLEQQEIRKLKEKKKEKTQGAGSLRVPADKLDDLVNLVGEMVTVQSRLSQVANQRHDAELLSIAEEVERLTEDLRDSTLNIRMLPIGSTFSKFKRLVRDISADLGKEVELKTTGAETELDKTVIEQLGDPLVHIIRNSMDHGIEMPDDRVAAGKPRCGQVHLSAEHSGDSVIIKISDDGKGMDPEVIRQKAISKEILSPDDQLSHTDLLNLVFAPGFSTAQQVTGLSGRGVGMDVVKRAIESLRGSITLESEKGKGSVVSLRIPLTLAIIESLLVQIDDGRYVLPLSAVEECVELTAQDIHDAHGRNLAKVRGHLVPYVPLREEFEIHGSPPAVQQIVITQINGQQLGFVVDNVIGEHQTVIKTLGPMYRDVQCVSGATILGDGSVALILDIVYLMQKASDEGRIKQGEGH